ncbi:MAG: exodeoxyribonuclease VII small subunit [Clostridia bacterium]|jgi:exodeoxyribonuclease VII small subunit|nr:exodeoxyribonuclease VII small subunit [Clostridia bacterium]
MNTEETKDALSFEEKLQQVQELTERIESGRLPLEDSVKEYERGMKILSGMSRELEDMKRRITILQDGKESDIPDENL